MKNSFGNHLTVTLFGESHGPYIGAVLDGLTPGLPIDEDRIRHQLDLRRPRGRISTSRVEKDEFILASGVYQGRATGTPLCILIPNKAQHSADYDATERLARPGHADYTAYCKYHGFEDYHGGGHFSGRITAALVAAGAIALTALESKGIEIGSHIKSCGGISDRDFADMAEDIRALKDKTFAVLDETKSADIYAVMEAAAQDMDSIGGVLETAIINVPAGAGEPWFDTVEGLLSHALYSIPAIKGVQFGAGFDLVDERGSVFNDPLRNEAGRIVTSSNNNGGINGGITNGMPIVFRCAVKPTPSIYKKQQTIDILSGREAELEIQGRHDPAIIHRARVVVDSMAALTIYDILAGRYGTDFFA